MATRADTAASSLEDATVALINSEPDLRDGLRKLIATTIARAQHQMEFGAPDTRTTLIKATIPNFVKAMGRVEAGANEAEMREALTRIENMTREQIVAATSANTGTTPTQAPTAAAVAAGVQVKKKRAAR